MWRKCSFFAALEPMKRCPPSTIPAIDNDPFFTRRNSGENIHQAVFPEIIAAWQSTGTTRYKA